MANKTLGPVQVAGTVKKNGKTTTVTSTNPQFIAEIQNTTNKSISRPVYTEYDYTCVGYRDRTSLDSITKVGLALSGDVATYSNLSVIQTRLNNEISARIKHCFYSSNSKISGSKTRYNLLSSTSANLNSKSIDPEIGYAENTLTLNDLSTAIVNITRACSNISAINTNAKKLSTENAYMRANSVDAPSLSSNTLMLADDQQAVYTGLLQIMRDCICYADCCEYSLYIRP